MKKADTPAEKRNAPPGADRKGTEHSKALFRIISHIQFFEMLFSFSILTSSQVGAALVAARAPG